MNGERILFFRLDPALKGPRDAIEDLYSVLDAGSISLRSGVSGLSAMQKLYTALLNPHRPAHMVVDNATNGNMFRAQVFGPSWRFPFMSESELQIGNVYTHPDHRGAGIAHLGIRYLLDTLGEHAIWYLTEERNRASVRLAQSLGLIVVGSGYRSTRFPIDVRPYRIDDRLNGR